MKLFNVYIYSPKRAKKSHFPVLRNHSCISHGTVFLDIFYHIGNPQKWRITWFAFFVSPTLQLCLFLMERVNHKVVCNRLLELEFISFSFLCWYKYKGFVIDLDFLAESVWGNNWKCMIENLNTWHIRVSQHMKKKKACIRNTGCNPILLYFPCAMCLSNTHSCLNGRN